MSDERLTRWRCEVRRVIPAADDDLVEEVAQHAADRWAALRSAGHDPQECDARALREIADWRSVPVPVRSPRLTAARLWAGWAHDVRYSARTLRLHPMFSGGVTLLTAIAVAACAVAFAIVYGVLWRPLPYPEADRLVVLWQVRQGEQGQVSYPDFTDVAAASVFDRAAAMGGGRGSLRIGESIERVNMIDLEPQGYSMLGARPVLGRLLEPGDSGKPHVLISHRLWRRSLGSDPAIIGRPLWISGRTYTVVGVLQPEFDFELPIAPMLKLEQQDLWTMFDRTTPIVARRDVTTYEALLRLAPGVTLEQARAAVETISRRLAAAHPATNADRTLRLAPLKDEIVSSVRGPLLLVALASGVTLLIALANVAMLALMRVSARTREMLIRQALGAGRVRLHRQILIESACVTLPGAVAGFLAAGPILTAIVSTDALGIPRRDAIRMDGAVGLYAIGIALLTMVVLTAMPLRLKEGAVTLRTGARVAGHRMRASRRFAVAAELAIALVLCSAGALLGVSLARLFAVDPGFDPRGALAVRVSAYAARYPAAPDVQRFFATVAQNLESMPDVLAAAAGSSLPLSGQTSGTGVIAEGQPASPGARVTAGWQFVTPQYFETIGMRLRAGRDFTPDDNRHEGHVTIINEDLALRLFPGQSAIGRRIGVGGGESSGDWHEIVGVVNDVRHHGLDVAPAPRVYDLFGEHWGRTLYVVVRSRTPEAASLIGPVRRAISAIDPEAPVFDGATMMSLVARSAAARRMAALVAIGLAATAVLLALVGAYAVTAASVAERMTEIGIRAALGATPSDLLRLIAREGTVTALVGGAAGLAASVAAGRLIHAQLFGVRPSDIGLVIVASCLPPPRPRV